MSYYIMLILTLRVSNPITPPHFPILLSTYNSSLHLILFTPSLTLSNAVSHCTVVNDRSIGIVLSPKAASLITPGKLCHQNNTF